MIDASEGITRRKLLVLGASAALVPLAGLTGACDGSEEPARDPYARTPTGETASEAAEAPPGTAPRTEPTQAGTGQSGATVERQPTQAAAPTAQGAEGAGAQTAQAAQACDAGPLVTTVPEMEPLVTSLTYTNQSEKEDQRCGNCLLYTRSSDACGKCQLFAQGYVAEPGWCLSWQAKPAATGTS